MINLKHKRVGIANILSEYLELAKNLKSSQGKYEIMVGLGNAYYNNYQIRLAE